MPHTLIESQLHIRIERQIDLREPPKQRPRRSTAVHQKQQYRVGSYLGHNVGARLFGLADNETRALQQQRAGTDRGDAVAVAIGPHKIEIFGMNRLNDDSDQYALS